MGLVVERKKKDTRKDRRSTSRQEKPKSSRNEENITYANEPSKTSFFSGLLSVALDFLLACVHRFNCIKTFCLIARH